MKLAMPKTCSYCGTAQSITLDHLISSVRGGLESSDNTVWACRSCNSAKGACDLMAWYGKQNRFPPLLVLRRYLKLAFIYCRENDLLHCPVVDCPILPFDIDAIPSEFPSPAGLVLWQPQL